MGTEPDLSGWESVQFGLPWDLTARSCTLPGCRQIESVMNTSGAGRWYEDSAWRDAPDIDRRVQIVLENTEAAFRMSAVRLRACGQEHRARRVERFATWARFDLDEPVVAQQLYVAAARLRYIRQLEPLAGQALDKMLSLAQAGRGNVQLADPASGALRIIAQHGFDAEFLDHFEVVDNDRSACGRAARCGTQMMIADVITDPGFEPHRQIAAASGFRAVLSTPLVDQAGHLVGVISTHYPHPYAPPTRDMRIIKRYADLLAQALVSRLSAAPSAGSRCALMCRCSTPRAAALEAPGG